MRLSGYERQTVIRLPCRYNLRQEPYAVVPHVRICAGGAGQPASLPRPSIAEVDAEKVEAIGSLTLDSRTKRLFPEFENPPNPRGESSLAKAGFEKAKTQPELSWVFC